MARLNVHRTPQHIYAQVYRGRRLGHVLASASTVQKDVRRDLKGTGNVEAAQGRRQGDCRARQGGGHRAGRVRSLRVSSFTGA